MARIGGNFCVAAEATLRCLVADCWRRHYVLYFKPAPGSVLTGISNIPANWGAADWWGSFNLTKWLFPDRLINPNTTARSTCSPSRRN